MNNNATSGKETSESVDEQRAEWEGRNFAMTVCRNGRLACAGPGAFDLSTEFPVPICAECAREARGL